MDVGGDWVKRRVKTRTGREDVKVALTLFAIKVVSDDIGHQLLSEITEHRRLPASERLAVSLPRLGNFQFLRRLVEAFEKGCDLHGVLMLSVPVDVSMAQLWPNNMDHFDKSSGSWIVAIGRRRLAIQPSEYRLDMPCYSISVSE